MTWAEKKRHTLVVANHPNTKIIFRFRFLFCKYFIHFSVQLPSNTKKKNLPQFIICANLQYSMLKISKIWWSAVWTCFFSLQSLPKLIFFSTSRKRRFWQRSEQCWEKCVNFVCAEHYVHCEPSGVVELNKFSCQNSMLKSEFIKMRP